MSRDEAADRRVSAVDYCALESTPYGFAQVSRGFAQVSRVVSRRYRAGIAGIADIAGFAEVFREVSQGSYRGVSQGIARYHGSYFTVKGTDFGVHRYRSQRCYPRSLERRDMSPFAIALIL